MAREETEEKEYSGTQLWALFGAWGAPCGCFEASELLVTPAFLPAIFFSFSHPSSAPTPAQGQEGAAALLLVGGESGGSWEQGPTSGCSGVAVRVRGVIFLKFQGGGRGILAEQRVLPACQWSLPHPSSSFSLPSLPRQAQAAQVMGLTSSPVRPPGRGGGPGRGGIR